ncbi:glycosyltransferase family 9 protein [Enterobacter sp. ENT03]|uniref:glycosyltransferase family 9 protein n=1 Tax=Enterobacter sp. ENT03 TaxID=2854780 RepID=UPI001C4684F3|nr:glycosyltransferase family 9 protein [Enterobacter sp. ENT03]MBV7403917.1 hypothetical protein [Enterobacter sp. ENT03]
MKIKIYIEPASLPLTNQLADYAACFDHADTFKIIMFERMTLDGAALQPFQTLFSKGVNLNLPQKIEKIGQFIARLQPEGIEIHSNLFRSGEIVLPLLCQLVKHIDVARVKLHLWDDGLTGIMERRRLVGQPYDTLQKDKHAMRAMLIDTLTTPVNSITPQRGNLFLNYLWSEVVATTWHLLCPALTPALFYRLFPNVARHCVAMRFQVSDRLNAGQFAFYQKLVALPETLRDRLTPLAQHPQALLFLGTFRYPRCFSELHQRALLRKISELKAAGKLPPPALILFKGHPENRLYNAQIAAALGEEVTTIPEDIPVEFLESLGLLPQQIAGSFGVSFLTLRHKQVPFLLLNEDDTHPQTRDYVALIADSLRINPRDILFLGESRKAVGKRIIYSSASMGDMLYALGAIKALKQHQPQFVTLVVHDIYRDIARRCPWVDEVLSIETLTSTDQQQIAVALEWGRAHDFSDWKNIIDPLHMTDAFLREFALAAPAAHKNIELTSNKADGHAVDKFLRRHQLTGQKIVLLHPNRGAANRRWTAAAWSDLAARFIAQGWAVVVIGHGTNKHHYGMFSLSTPGIINAVDTFTVMETLYLMRQSHLLVSCDSGPIALAGATDIAICGLYSQIKAAYRLPYRHGEAGWKALGINLDCDYAGCGQYIQDVDFYHDKLHRPMPLITSDYFANWCPASSPYHCLQTLSAATVFARIQTFLAAQ